MSATTFTFHPVGTMDSFGAPHVTNFHASRHTDGTAYSCWGYAVECAGCGKREENAGASSVSATDAPPRFAREHRECMTKSQKDRLEIDHTLASARYVVDKMEKWNAEDATYGGRYYADQLASLAIRLKQLTN